MSHRDDLRFLAGALILTTAPGCGADALPIVTVMPDPPPPEPRILAVAADPPTPPLPYRCTTNRSFEAAGRSYCVHDTESTWDEAQAHCRNDGGHLASIGSAAENDALRAALGSPAGALANFWIGLSEIGSRDWKWMSGERLGAAAWSEGEPNNAGGKEQCVEWLTSNGRWNDLGCGESRDYLCEKLDAATAARTRLTHTRGKPKPMPFTCGGRAFTVGAKEYCFHQGAPTYWIEAAKTCDAEGGALAMPRSAAENDALIAALGARLGAPRAWIGFTDRGHEGRWVWSSGAPARFLAWRDGEPNNVGGEDCAEWYASDGGWNDLHCSTRLWSLCQAP